MTKIDEPSNKGEHANARNWKDALVDPDHSACSIRCVPDAVDGEVVLMREGAE